jgi:hypothetical protein
MPTEYREGVASDPAGSFYFSGVWTGLYRTGPTLLETARNRRAIPRDVRQLEGYNHIGDISWDAGEGGRLLLPLDCLPTSRRPVTSCNATAIAVVDPHTLAWRYHVRLHPAYMSRIRWVEASPDGSLIWTSSGRDFIAYRASDVTAANASSSGRALVPVRRVRRARAPTPAVSGAAFYGDNLLVAGSKGTLFELWSIDLASGFRRYEAGRSIVGRAGGLDAAAALASDLHWQVQPTSSVSGPPTYGSRHATMLSLEPTPAYGRSGRCAWIRDGSAGQDHITGTSAGDLVSGRSGNDRLLGRDGEDCLAGGAGRDRVSGGPGRDRVSGGDGSDRLGGGRDADRVFGGHGRDLLRGGPGRDKLLGGEGHDSLHSRDGRRDVVLCGAGRDRVRADPIDRLLACERVRR